MIDNDNEFFSLLPLHSTRKDWRRVKKGRKESWINVPIYLQCKLNNQLIDIPRMAVHMGNHRVPIHGFKNMPDPRFSIRYKFFVPPPPVHGLRNIPDPCFSMVYRLGGICVFRAFPCPAVFQFLNPDPAIPFSIRPPATPPIMGARAAARMGRKPPLWFAT